MTCIPLIVGEGSNSFYSYFAMLQFICSCCDNSVGSTAENFAIFQLVSGIYSKSVATNDCSSELATFRGHSDNSTVFFYDVSINNLSLLTPKDNRSLYDRLSSSQLMLRFVFTEICVTASDQSLCL